MAATSIFVAVPMLFITKESWLISRETNPKFTVMSGVLHQVQPIPMGKGGTIGIGQNKIYLHKGHLREV